MKTVKSKWLTPTVLQREVEGTKDKRRKTVTRSTKTVTDFQNQTTSAVGTKTITYKKGKKAGTTKVKPMSTKRALLY